jgi:hypothetical protein
MNSEESIFEEKTGPSKELRVLAAACYFPFGFVLPYFLGKNAEAFVMFHLKQGLALFFALIVIGIFPIDGSFGFGLFLYFILGGWTGYRAYQ